MKFIAHLVLSLPFVSAFPIPSFSTVSKAGQAGTRAVSGTVVQSQVTSPTSSQRLGTTSTSTSATSTPTSTGNGTDALTTARGEVVQGLNEVSVTLPQLKNTSLATNNTAVSSLADQASSSLALAVGGVETISSNLKNGLPPNTGSNPQGQVASALVDLNTTVSSMASAVTSPDPALLSLIDSAQKSVLLAIQGGEGVAAAEGLSFSGLAASPASTTLPAASQGEMSVSSSERVSITGAPPALTSPSSKSEAAKSTAGLGSKTTPLKTTTSGAAQSTTPPFAQDSSSGFNPLAPNAQGSQGAPPFNPLAPGGQGQSPDGISGPSANRVH